MHRAYRNLQRIKREQAALNELPVAQLTSLTANLNRDPSKNAKVFFEIAKTKQNLNRSNN